MSNDAKINSVNVRSAFNLTGQSALITGGGTGLGLSMARCLAAAGARVVIVGRRPTELTKACAEISGDAFPLPGDVTQLETLPALVASAEQRVGPLSILINNAGVHLKKSAVDTTSEEFLTVLSTHVLGAHALTRAVLPGMIERRQGSILFTASMASLFGLPQVIAYAAAKSAYLGMVRTLATEVSPHQVRVNALAPGWIESEMMRRALDHDPARRDKILSRTPMGHFGEADDIGWAAVYLCSPAAKFVTGIVLPVDGGVSIGF
jgi:gluconate 5-dehydrogenase